MGKIIADPLRGLLAEELAGRTDQWSELAKELTDVIRRRFDVVEKAK